MAEVQADSVQALPTVPADDIYTGSDEPAVEIPELDAAPPPPPKEPPSPPPPEKKAAHSIELIEQARLAQFTPEEIDEMSPKDLKRAVDQANRLGQHVWGWATQEAAKKSAPEPKANETPLDFGVDEEGNKIDEKEIHPGIRNALRKIAKDSEKKSQEALDRVQQDRAARDVHDRVGGLIVELGPEVAKSLNRGTAKGHENFGELMVMMQSIHSAGKQSGKNYTEKELLSRAVRAMDLIPPVKPSNEEIELAAKKQAWDKAGLAKPESRTTADNEYTRVAKILKEIRDRAPEDAEYESPFQD